MKINNNNKNAPKESAVLDSNYSFHSEGFIHRSEVELSCTANKRAPHKTTARFKLSFERFDTI